MNNISWKTRGSGSWVCCKGEYALALYRGGAYSHYAVSRIDSDRDTWIKAQRIPALFSILKTQFLSLRQARLAVETVLNSLPPTEL